MNLKFIILKWLDRTLNPDWTKKFIITLLLLGSALIISPVLATIVDVTISNPDLSFSVAISDRTSSLWDFIAPFIGVIFVVISVILFYLKHQEGNIDEPQVLDVLSDGRATFLSMEDPKLHALYFKDKKFVKIEFRNPNYNYRYKQIIVSGGDSSNPIWGEYIETYPITIQPYVIEIRKVVEQNNWYTKTGKDMNNTVFEFIDGVTFAFSWRAWGDLIQAIGYQREGYLNHYM
jgi:hypothetical protein